MIKIMIKDYDQITNMMMQKKNWKEIGIKKLGGYHDLYNQRDKLLSDVFERF